MANRIDRDRPAGRDPRTKRLVATLRANLHKRKEQARARQLADDEAEEAGPSHDSAGIAADKADRPR